MVTGLKLREQGTHSIIVLALLSTLIPDYASKIKYVFDPCLFLDLVLVGDRSQFGFVLPRPFLGGGTGNRGVRFERFKKNLMSLVDSPNANNLSADSMYMLVPMYWRFVTPRVRRSHTITCSLGMSVIL